MKKEDPNHVFVIGAPRSGTTLLSALISQHPSVAAVSGNYELTHFSRYIYPLIRSWHKEVAHIDNGDWNQGLPLLWKEDEFYTFLKDFTQKVYVQVHQNNPSASIILDKHPGYSRHVHNIKKILPRAKLIHIIRDGRDVINSMISANKRIGFGHGTSKLAAGEWLGCVSSAQEGHIYENEYLEIRYEQLIRKPSKVMNKVFCFLELNFDNEMLSELDLLALTKQVSSPTPRSHNLNSNEKWNSIFSVRQRFDIHNIAYNMLNKLDYETSVNWWSSNFLTRSWIRFNHLIITRLIQIKSRLFKK